MKGKVLNLLHPIRDFIVACLLAFIATMPVVEIISHFDELKHGLFELIAEEDSKERDVIEGDSENEVQVFYAINLMDLNSFFGKNNSFLNFQRRFANYHPEVPFLPPKNFTSA
ncbi:hypothetical protein DHD32_10820 [Arenibacter sp. TNZ]|uniref:hypothetical protein n=1 Tax=Arenibacter TaxID=178469 RepID=UPI000CD3FFE5|nr:MULTISPECIES: hypothetical protein [Arenibacter]MCM4171974.1 hypothetical protein [Arenibacter sp. TNZ]